MTSTNGNTLTKLLIVLILGTYGFTASIALILWNKSERQASAETTIINIQETVSQVKSGVEALKKDTMEIRAVHEQIFKFMENQSDKTTANTKRLDRIEKGPLRAYQ